MKEFYLYLSHFTFRRALNLLLCGVGYFFSWATRYPIVLGLPISVSTEPTTRCNLTCPECPAGNNQLKRNEGDMPLSRFTQIIKETSNTAFAVLLHFQGEPLMNKDIYEMISYATSHKMITEMATNAMLLDKENAIRLVKSGLKKMVITIDSPHADQFGFYRRGGSLGKVIQGIENIQQAKQEMRTQYPLIIIEMLAFIKNLNQIDDFVQLGKKVKADIIRIKTAQILNLESAQEKVPIGTKYSRYKFKTDGTISLKGWDSSHCSAPWFKLSVTHDGWVVPCCFDKSATYIMGTTDHQSLSEVWFSKHYNLFRKRLINHRKNLPLCSSCPHGRTPLDFNVF